MSAPTAAERAVGCTMEPGIEIQCASLEDVDASVWNGALARAPAARIQQTVQGARIRWCEEGQRPYFLRALRDGQPAGQCYLHYGFVHPDLMQWSRPLLKSSFLHRLWGVMSWFGGPVIFDGADYDSVLRAFLGEVERMSRRLGVAAIKGATPSFYGDNVDWPLVDAAFADFGYDKQQRATMVLDVEADRESLWGGLAKEARQKVRKAQKQNVQIVEDNTAAGLERYYAIRLENARRNGLRPPSRSSILASEQVYMREGMCKLFLAESYGEALAGQLLVVFNGYVQLAGICFSDRALQLRLPVNDLLQWHVIEWAQSSGQRRVDWSGYTPEPATEKEAGINRFKAKWGGAVVHYHTYDKIRAPRRFAALDWTKTQARKFNIR